MSEKDDIFINGIRYNSFADAKNKTGLSTLKLRYLIDSDEIGFVNDEYALENKNIIKTQELKKKINAKKSSERAKKLFKNFVVSEETKRKISESNKKVFHYWQDKVNKNPEKIRKTANKHRGMKRSEESRKRMSESAKGRIPKNKGMVRYWNITEQKYKYYKPDCIPENCIRKKPDGNIDK